jgi:hypothetical protein
VGWRVRHGIAGDVPFLIGIITVAGAAAGAVLGAVAVHVYDKVAHHHRGTL